MDTKQRGSVGGAPADGHQGGFIDVCFWHLADIPPALTNVRHRG